MSMEIEERVPRQGIPHLNSIVAASRCQLLAIRTEYDSPVAGEDEEFFSCLGIPYTHAFVTSRSQTCPIRAEHHRPHPSFVPCRSSDNLAGGCIPDSNEPLGTDRSNTHAIRTKSEARNTAYMRSKRQEFLRRAPSGTTRKIVILPLSATGR